MYKFIGKATLSLVGVGTLLTVGAIGGIFATGLAYFVDKEGITNAFDEFKEAVRIKLEEKAKTKEEINKLLKKMEESSKESEDKESTDYTEI